MSVTSALILPLFVLLNLSCASSPHAAKREIALSNSFGPPTSDTLFSSYETLNIKLSAPFTTLFQAKLLGKEKFKELPVKGTLIIDDLTLRVQIVLKGNSTAIMCPFPKMELMILDDAYGNTIFSESKTFDLNTHCADKDSRLDEAFKASYYNHREALAYRILDILDIPTFRARPVIIQYLDENKAALKYSQKYQAFLLEDTSSFLKRIDAREIKGFNDGGKESAIRKNPKKAAQYLFTDLSEAPQIDREDAARIALFNEMIGNYDWFIKADSKHMRSKEDLRNLWNVKIVETSNGRWIPFPFDFGLAAVVTGISQPNPYMRVFSSVDLKSQEKLKKQFHEKRIEILQLSLSLDKVGQRYYEETLNKFFEVNKP